MVLVVAFSVMMSSSGSEGSAASQGKKPSDESPSTVAAASPSAGGKPQVPVEADSKPVVAVRETLPQETSDLPAHDMPLPPVPKTPETPPPSGTQPDLSEPTPAPVLQTPADTAPLVDAERRLKRQIGEAKTELEYQVVARESLRLADQTIAAGDTDAAKRFSTLALSAAREARDNGLARAASLHYLEFARRFFRRRQGTAEQETRTTA